MFTIDAALVKQFNSDITILSQQKGSRLRDKVMLKTGIVGETDYLDQIGKTDAVKRTTRNGDTPLVKTEHQRRKIDMVDYDWADLLDKADKRKMLADPTNKYTVNGAYAIGRALDIEIVNKAFAISFVGKEGGSQIAFPTSTNQVAAGASGLTINKILAAKKILDNNDVGTDEPRYIAHTGTQLQDLLKEDKTTNADYAAIRALVRGEVNTFLGFEFVLISTSILLTDSSNFRRVICWAKNGLGLGITEDIQTDISIRKDKNLSTQVWASIGCGSSRIDEDKVIEILCKE